MTWLKLLKVGAQLLLTFMQWLQEKQLLDAGEAKAIGDGLTFANEAIDEAIKAREAFEAARKRGDIGPDDDDGYRRD